MIGPIVPVELVVFRIAIFGSMCFRNFVILVN